MHPRRKLVLKKETLTELSPGELQRVVGGEPTNAFTQPVKYCVTDLLTCYNTCMSWNTEQCESPA